MAGTSRMPALAFLFVAILVASSAVPAAEAYCFPDCYDRCANGQVGNVACTNMCAQACIVPEKTPNGVDLDKLAAGLDKLAAGGHH